MITQTKSGRPPLMSAPFVRLLLASVGALGSFYLLMPVVPLYAATATDGTAAAGLVTGALMAGTVATEFFVPRLLDRFGYRSMIAVGLLLLGAPALVLLSSAELPVVLGVSLVRGAGLAVLVVSGGALVAEIVPTARRGEALGVYGVAVGVPSIACLPAGVWLHPHTGFAPLLVAGALLSLAALAAVPGLPARSIVQRTPDAHSGGVLRLLRDPQQKRPALVFAAICVTAGIVLTFLPMAVPEEHHQFAAVGLLVQSCLTPLARWWAGRYADRRPQGGNAALIVPAVVFAMLGTTALVWIDQPIAVIVALGLFGIGFGIGQNATLAVMFDRAPRQDAGRVSALWNLAYDGGMGAGAVGFGLIAGPVGYPIGFAVTAALLLAATVPAWRGRTGSPIVTPAPSTAPCTVGG